MRPDARITGGSGGGGTATGGEGRSGGGVKALGSGLTDRSKGDSVEERLEFDGLAAG